MILVVPFPPPLCGTLFYKIMSARLFTQPFVMIDLLTVPDILVSLYCNKYKKNEGFYVYFNINMRS